MSTRRDELLVNGYIREIKAVLSKHFIIPIDIISLCSLFWGKSLQFIFIANNKMNIFDTINKKISTIKKYSSYTQNALSLSPPLCYIPNISSKLTTPNMNKQKSYDAILCRNYKSISSVNDPVYNSLLLLLFKSNLLYFSQQMSLGMC